MTTTQLPPPVTSAGRAASVSATPPRRFLAALEDRRLVLANVGPNWFTSVMGTSIVATAAAVLWVLGTVYGLATAVAVPYWAFTRHDVPEDGAFGGWLMPVVPPMVSEATGALLIPHTAPGQLRLTLLTLCYSMFGLSLLASLVVITLLCGRLAQHKVGAAATVPTLWIVLGPLRQSITAANNLGTEAQLALPAPFSTAFRALGPVYGLPCGVSR